MGRWAAVTPSFPVTLQFEGQEISLDSRMGIFITMNPGYAGRTELPESVKALFRPVVVIVPDLQQICEIMLFSEGFLWAKVSLAGAQPRPAPPGLRPGSDQGLGKFAVCMAYLVYALTALSPSPGPF